jgi:four helix bundle protein
MSDIKSHKDLIVWQKSIKLVVHIYRLTDTFPKTEIYGITSQIRRAAVSIPSNIAEGKGRGTRADFAHFLVMARGSGCELETQLTITENLGYITKQELGGILTELDEVMKMLNGLISSLKTST